MYVRAIRGAITVDSNTESDIFSQTQKLISQIITKNSLKHEDIISIIFTVTDDITAAYPAAAVRQMGIVDVPLMCMREMKVPGSLEKCIRVLIHINTMKAKTDMRHVYLEGAKCLRPDITEE
ncbi:MAG TPA: chorismate mutase [Clostridiaceae bacterium]|nr:chorismate mutase [Clostridiaceae bacterium]